jgi:trk/ktr system potassium uptake protein
MKVLVLGCGRVGSELAYRLAADDHEVSIIDREPRAFARLPADFPGTKVEGIGFDRDVLNEAGIREADAFAAVSSGDNSNILTARIAREHYNVAHVVARIADPLRAELYTRLGITTVAAVPWQAHRIALLLGAQPDEQWSDATGDLALLEVSLPSNWAGRPLGGLEVPGVIRLTGLRRAGRGQVGDPSILAQEDDTVLLCISSSGREVLEGLLGDSPRSDHASIPGRGKH